MVDASPASLTAPPAAISFGVAERTATGVPWIVTVTNAGLLCTPRLSVTTSENVTVPEVFGTVTEMLECGAEVDTDGFAGVS